jgi:prevent-host-death family protein
LLQASGSSYTRVMSSFTASDLRAHTAEILRRVEAGEEIEILRGDIPMAKIIPLPSRRRWLPASEVVRVLLALGPDTTKLAEDLRQAVDETADELR